MQDRSESCSLFRNILAKKPKGTMSPEELVKAVREGRTAFGSFKGEIERLRNATEKKRRDEIKRQLLPAITTSGSFESRKKEGIVQHSGLIQIDIDDAPDVRSVKCQLADDPYTLMCFISPSGNGVKAVVRVLADSTRHKAQFRALERRYMEQFGIKIDPSCKDVSRLMLLSYDPEIVYHPEASVFEELVLESPKSETRIGRNYPNHVAQDPKGRWISSGEEVDEFVKLIDHLEKLHLDIAPDYQRWWQLAFAISSTFGEGGRNYFMRICKLHPEFDEKACDQKYDQALANKNNAFSLRTVYYLAKQAEAGIQFVADVPKELNQSTAHLPSQAHTTEAQPTQEAEPDSNIRIQLKQLRNELAEKYGIKHFQVFSNATLEEIAERVPKSLEQLLNCRGIGRVKVEDFGQDILRVTLRQSASTTSSKTN